MPGQCKAGAGDVFVSKYDTGGDENGRASSARPGLILREQ